MKKLRIVILGLARRDRKWSLNDGRIQNPSNPFGIVPLSRFEQRGFGFVHHSIAILYHEVPNLNITIRNFFIAVSCNSFCARKELSWSETAERNSYDGSRSCSRARLKTKSGRERTGVGKAQAHHAIDEALTLRRHHEVQAWLLLSQGVGRVGRGRVGSSLRAHSPLDRHGQVAGPRLDHRLGPLRQHHHRLVHAVGLQQAWGGVPRVPLSARLRCCSSLPFRLCCVRGGTGAVPRLNTNGESLLDASRSGAVDSDWLRGGVSAKCTPMVGAVQLCLRLHTTPHMQSFAAYPKP
jgi:hypothetical protein